MSLHLQKQIGLIARQLLYVQHLQCFPASQEYKYKDKK